jgi:hypothetical protein
LATWSFRISLTAAIALVTSCGCKADLGVRFDPPERFLVVGETFTPSIHLLGCGGTEPLSDEITWAAQDTAIVRVDAGSGRTTALRPGDTFVLANGRTYHGLGGVHVVIRAQ